VAILNEAFAKAFFNGDDPTGFAITAFIRSWEL
jgi:hypothetical protein